MKGIATITYEFSTHFAPADLAFGIRAIMVETEIA